MAQEPIQGAHRRTGTRFRVRGLPAVLTAMVWLGAGSAPAAAQLSDLVEDTAPDTTEVVKAAGPDTAAVSKVIGNLSPTYTTNYNVARQVTIWEQDFEFGAGFKFLDFTNKTRFDVRTDDGRDETLRSGGNQLDLRWLMIRRLPITTSLSLDRESIKRPGDEKQSNDASVNLSTVFNMKVGTIRHTFTAGGGYSRRTNLSVRNELRSESKDSGVTGNLSWRGRWTPLDPVAVDANIQESRSNKTSELQNEEGALETRPTRNRNRNFRMGASYNPAPWLSGKVSASDNAGNDEFFIVQGGRGDLERKVNSSRSISAGFTLKPLPATTLGLDLGANERNLEYRVRTDVASSGNGSSWAGSIDTQILGATVNGKLNRTRDVLEPATSSKTTNETSVFDGVLKRPLSSKIDLQFNWLLRASQLFFGDTDPVNFGDRDERRTKFQPTLNYNPGNKWSATVSYTRSTSRQVQINPRRATQTQDEEDFTVDMMIQYQLSDATSLSQNYSIKALYTTFDFAPGSNRLLSTQRIVSQVRSAITPKVDLKLEHRFTLQDSGPFSFNEGGGRVFARSLRKYRQELSTNIEYRILSWLTLKTDSRFLRTDDVNESANRRTVFRNLELKTGGSVNKSLGEGASLRADALFIRSNIQKSYWTLTSSLTKEF